MVAEREFRWLVHDRVALLLIFGVPLFAFVVLTTVFSATVIRGLGVTVVDEDRSDASRALIEYIAASPSLHIVDRADTRERCGWEVAFEGAVATGELAALQAAKRVTQAVLVEGRNRVRMHEPSREVPPGFEPEIPTLEDA